MGFLRQPILHARHYNGAENTSSNACMNRGSSFSGSRLIPAALFLPPPVAKREHSVSAPPPADCGARTLTTKAPSLRCVRTAWARSGDALARELPKAPLTRRLHG